jgi:hypothetical protein
LPLPAAGGNLLHLFGPLASIRRHESRSGGPLLLGYSPKSHASRQPFGRLHRSN